MGVSDDPQRDIATRTHNAVATLAASLKEVVTRQQKYERGLNLNSFVAYLLFTVLLGGGFALLYRSRAGRDRRRGLRRRHRGREGRAVEAGVDGAQARAVLRGGGAALGADALLL